MPRGFHKWAEDGERIQYLVGAAIRAMTDGGLQPAEGAADAIGNTLKRNCAKKSGKEMVALVERWVNCAGTDDPGAGWIASRPA